jgi:hypothetical protein
VTRALWLAVGLALAAHLAGVRYALTATVLLVALQGARSAPLWARTSKTLALEVAVAYLLLLLLGTSPSLVIVHFLELAGTIALVVFGYCPLARVLSLLPWHRRSPITRARLVATFLSPPTGGDLLEHIEAAVGAGEARRTSAGRSAPRRA